MIGTTLSGRYKLESKLGSGGMSTVYLATDQRLGRQVAIKILHREMSDQPDQLERFTREARSVAMLSHPNLVGVIDFGDDEGHPYIVFEYVPGQTLKQRIDSQGQLALDEATAYAIEIGRGLAAAHVARLIHRDVKPQNVLIDRDGRAKVTDFGIARSLESHGLTATGRVLGTTDYVSPEQAMGKEVDARTDVYSLGILLFEMLTGDLPFHAETQVGVAMKHVNEGMPNVQKRRGDVSSALAAALERATAKEPGERYSSMNAFLADLEGALEVEVARAGTSTGEATTVLDSVPARKRRLFTPSRISWATALILMLAAASAIAIAALTGGEKDDPARANEPGAAARTLEIGSATDFDPIGGDGEHSDEVNLAIDGNAESTAWTTETYVDAELGGKAGVGLIVSLESPGAPTELALNSKLAGWSLEVYGTDASSPPEEAPLEDGSTPWGSPLAAPDNLAKAETIQLNSVEGNRHFLLWATGLADAGGDGFRVEIADVELAE